MTTFAFLRYTLAATLWLFILPVSLLIWSA